MLGSVARLNKRLTIPVARLLKDHVWVSPDLLTASSFLTAGVAAPLLVLLHHYAPAALMVLLGAWLDSLDGDLARVRGQASRKGAILDAVLDRYIDLFVVGAMTAVTGCVFWGILAMVGSTLVPYVRAKTEAVGRKSVRTFASRDIRNAIVFLGLVSGFPCVTLAVLAVLANLSALHRLIWALKTA